MNRVVFVNQIIVILIIFIEMFQFPFPKCNSEFHAAPVKGERKPRAFCLHRTGKRDRTFIGKNQLLLGPTEDIRNLLYRLGTIGEGSVQVIRIGENGQDRRHTL